MKFLYNKTCMPPSCIQYCPSIAGDHDASWGRSLALGIKLMWRKITSRFHAELSLALFNSRNLSLQMASDSPMPVTTSYDIHVTV
jgi:hypothetical protein